jgi:hypothetical protein
MRRRSRAATGDGGWWAEAEGTKPSALLGFWEEFSVQNLQGKHDGSENIDLVVKSFF